ncbi:MAG: beta-ketoacyl-[acyl-carrier-protein] synthase family protein [bacterium]
MADRHQVVITGIGLVTPLGINKQENWSALLAGKSGTCLSQDPALQDYAHKIIAPVKDTPEYTAYLDAIVDKKIQRKTERFIHFGLLAAHEAMRDAGLDQLNHIDRTRFGCYMGVGLSGVQTISDGALALSTRGHKAISPFLIPRAINNLAPGWISMSWDLRGPSLAVTSACSSGGDAIGFAYRQIRDGYADYMLAGGVESCIVPLAVMAFGNMRTLSGWQGDPAQASRPFDAQRTGFVMAEGAGIITLERKDLALKRGAPIYAELAGYAATSDAYHITAMHPEGRGAIDAINQALASARINPSDVGYVNAHGTGTLMNDSLETMVLKKVFGHHITCPTQFRHPRLDLGSIPYIKNSSNHVLVSSTKSMTGHMIGAAGGVEAAITALALKHQIVPPTINLDNPDPACDLDYVAGQAREVSMRYALSNSFGFGGCNAVLALKKSE